MMFVQAKNYRQANRTQIDWIVLHSTESPRTSTNAEDTARYFATTERPASANYCVDNNSVVQCVRDKDIAYHCGPTGNKRGIGIEQAGHAAQSREEWLDDYGTPQLELVTSLIADKCEEFDLPSEYVDAAGLKAGHRGITTHHQITLAFGESTHTDPGDNYPMDYVINRVKAKLNPGPVEGPSHILIVSSGIFV